jgi:UDP-2,3-diacylglucosamine hydrolase
MDEPLLWVAGDVHLRGDEGAFPAFLDRLAERPRPGRLVLLGDIFESWCESTACVVQHAAVLQRLRGLRRAGWRVDLVLGNREFIAGRRLACAAGVAMHWPRLDLCLAGRRIRIIHGDRLCHDPGYRLLAMFMRGYWLQTLVFITPGWFQAAVARLLRRNSRGHRPRPPGRQPFLDPRRVAACGRGVDLLLAGHIHRQERRRLRGVELILCGDWGPRHGSWVTLGADGQPRLERQRSP